MSVPVNESASHRRLVGVLNHDFCPGANRWVYWLKQPLWCLVLAATTALICGVFVNPNAYAGCGVLVAVLGIGVIWPWLSLQGLSGQVEFGKRRAREGEPVLVTLRLRNRWPWPAWGVRLEQGLAGAGSSGGVALARVPAWRTSEFRWDVRPPLRGVYPLEAPRLESRFPFGLIRARKLLNARNRLLVWPKAVPLHDFPDAAGADGRDGPLSDRRVGEFGDTTGTRPFRDGDSLRRVHWAQSARHQRLIVCERQRPVGTAIRLFVDLNREHHRGRGPNGSLEETLRIAASICESAARYNGSVECRLGAQVFQIGFGASELKRLLDATAHVPLEGLPPESDVPRARTTAGEKLLVVITTDLGLNARDRARWPTERRLIVVPTDGSAGAVADEEHRPGMDVPNLCDLSFWFPRAWRRACNAI